MKYSLGDWALAIASALLTLAVMAWLIATVGNG